MGNRRIVRIVTAGIGISVLLGIAAGCGARGEPGSNPPALSAEPGPSGAAAAPEVAPPLDGVLARAVSSAFPVEGRNLRLIRRGDEVVPQFEMFNGTREKFEPNWTWNLHPPMMLVDLPRSTAYLVPTRGTSNDALISMNTVDGIAPGASATVTVRFTAPPSETTEVLVMMEYLLPVTVPIRPEGTPVRDDPVLALPKGTRSTEERVVSCTAKGADGPAGQPTAVELRLPSDVLFEFGSAALSGQAQAAIESLKDKIPSGGGTVSVEGHTDAIGDDAANQTLSEQRAAAVRGALAAQLGSGYTFAPAGFGERKPIAPNQNADGSDNPSGRAQNRRVEIRVGTVTPGTPPSLRPAALKTLLAEAGLRAEVAEVRRVGGYVIAAITVHNPTAGPVEFPVNNGLIGLRSAPSGMTLADRTAGRRYELCDAYRTGDRQTIGNSGSDYSPITFDMLPAGETVTFWGLYLAPPPETTTLDVEIGGFGTVAPQEITS